jgi:hypothetical protein
LDRTVFAVLCLIAVGGVGRAVNSTSPNKPSVQVVDSQPSWSEPQAEPATQTGESPAQSITPPTIETEPSQPLESGEEPGVEDEADFDQNPPILSFSQEGEQFAFTLIRTSEIEKPFYVPTDWQCQKTMGGGRYSYRWTAPDGPSFVRLDTGPATSESLRSTYESEEKRFQSSKRYQYKFVKVREGSDAYLGGLIWNFSLQKDDGPLLKRTVAYCTLGSMGYAVSTGYPEGSPNGTGRMFTEILNSLHRWTDAQP